MKQFSEAIQVYESEFGGRWRPLTLWERFIQWYMWTFYPAEMKNEVRWFTRALDQLYYGGERYDDPCRLGRITILPIDRI